LDSQKNNYVEAKVKWRSKEAKARAGSAGCAFGQNLLILTSSCIGGNRAHKPEAQAKGVRKFISFNILRLRFRLVASDFPGIVCILDGD